MKINEVIIERIETPEAVYGENLGFEEVVKFFVVAERENPDLAQEVEELIEREEDASAWKIIQEFLDVNLKGAQFSVAEGKEINEADNKAAQILHLRREFQKLQMAPGMGGKEMAEKMKARKARLNTQIAAIQRGDSDDTNKPAAQMPVKRKQKVYHIDMEHVEETATAGGTSAGNIASIANPHLSPGKARGNKSYTGSPGKSGTKSPAQPKVVQKKKADGTAKGAHEIGGNLFGGGAVKR